MEHRLEDVCRGCEPVPGVERAAAFGRPEDDRINRSLAAEVECRIEQHLAGAGSSGGRGDIDACDVGVAFKFVDRIRELLYELEPEGAGGGGGFNNPCAPRA